MPGTFTKSLALAQESFAKVLSSCADKSDLIRFLEWHVSSHGISPGHAFLELFPQLRGVRRLHIIDAHPTDVGELSLVIPPLFPKLEEVHFSGLTHLPFVMPILHSPHNLRFITFDAPCPHSIHLQLLRWFRTAAFQRLEKLSLWALCTSERSKVEETIEEWIQIFDMDAVPGSVQEVVLGFRSQRGRICNKEEQHGFTTNLLNGLSSIFEWPRLRKLHLIGFSLFEKDLTTLYTDSPRRIHIEITTTIADTSSIPFPATSQTK
ncbi:hypothetical protein Clacol_001055 [Clathrus columnatus]|uniref:Uncharacterized protein n=1 Tax=Clathrus columnatus TaxID=1419009 RepID=A0AAV5A0Q7_9AGAM|nr:hypothetical protein Clacol_001055 [Clathrus columnatus]